VKKQLPKQFLYIEKNPHRRPPLFPSGNAFVPVRKEEWIESEEYPGIWTNASGEIMDGATKKVRTVTTAFNPKTRRYSSRVWLNGEYKAVWWQQLMIERNRLRPKKGGA